MAAGQLQETDEFCSTTFLRCRETLKVCQADGASLRLLSEDRLSVAGWCTRWWAQMMFLFFPTAVLICFENKSLSQATTHNYLFFCLTAAEASIHISPIKNNCNTDFLQRQVNTFGFCLCSPYVCVSKFLFLCENKVREHQQIGRTALDFEWVSQIFSPANFYSFDFHLNGNKWASASRQTERFCVIVVFWRRRDNMWQQRLKTASRQDVKHFCPI